MLVLEVAPTCPMGPKGLKGGYYRRGPTASLRLLAPPLVID
jgi:hypothetical protein